MFSDWTIADRVKSLEEYNRTLFDAQENAHGSDYMLVHNEIKKLKEDAKTSDEALAIADRDQHDLRNRLQRYMSAVELAKQALEEGG